MQNRDEKVRKSHNMQIFVSEFVWWFADSRELGFLLQSY